MIVLISYAYRAYFLIQLTYAIVQSFLPRDAYQATAKRRCSTILPWANCLASACQNIWRHFLLGCRPGHQSLRSIKTVIHVYDHNKRERKLNIEGEFPIMGETVKRWNGGGNASLSWPGVDDVEINWSQVNWTNSSIISTLVPTYTPKQLPRYVWCG